MSDRQSESISCCMTKTKLSEVVKKARLPESKYGHSLERGIANLTEHPPQLNEMKRIIRINFLCQNECNNLVFLRP